MKQADDSAFRARMGEHVRALRLARELTQVRFAERCDVSPDTVRRLELGSFSPSITTLRAVTGGLGISLGTFFDSLENGERLVEREILDLLATCSVDEQHVALRVLLALFDDHRRVGSDESAAESVERGRVVEQVRETTTDGAREVDEHVHVGVVLPGEDGQ
jgi:transcriptional regulator with XRE-family HTH domain